MPHSTAFLSPSPLPLSPYSHARALCRLRPPRIHCTPTCSLPPTTPDNDSSTMQGPSQAPTQSGVSTAGLSDTEVEFITACYDADVSKISELLPTVSPNTADVNGRTALHFCAGNGLVSICEQLLQNGAEINKQDILGYTPLHMATGYRMGSTVRLLVEKGADANIQDFKGVLPVELAEGLLENMPKGGLFGGKDKYNKMNEIVQVLDQATEVEEDEDEDEVVVADDDMFQSKEDGVSFSVKVRSKDEVRNDTPQVKEDGVEVTIRVKEAVNNKETKEQ